LKEVELEHSHWKTLEVDYDPNKILHNAATIAKIKRGCFPCKTFTRIEDDNSVTAKYQYGGKFEKL